MSPALNGSSVIRRFKGSDAIEIRDGITFNFYTGLTCVLHPLLHSLQACTTVNLPSEESRTKLVHMTKMLQMYATKEFSNGCDLWLAGICRYLNDAYAPIASDLLGLMAEVSLIVCHYNHLHSRPLHPPPPSLLPPPSLSHPPAFPPPSSFPLTPSCLPSSLFLPSHTLLPSPLPPPPLSHPPVFPPPSSFPLTPSCLPSSLFLPSHTLLPSPLPPPPLSHPPVFPPPYSSPLTPSCLPPSLLLPSHTLLPSLLPPPPLSHPPVFPPPSSSPLTPSCLPPSLLLPSHTLLSSLLPPPPLSHPPAFPPPSSSPLTPSCLPSSLLLPSHTLLPSLLHTPLSLDDYSLPGRLSSTHTQMLEKGQPLYYRPILRLLYHYLRLQDPNSQEMREIGSSIMTIVSQHLKVGGGGMVQLVPGRMVCLFLSVLCVKETRVILVYCAKGS